MSEQFLRFGVRSSFRDARAFLFYARRYPAGHPVRATYVATARRHRDAAHFCLRELRKGV